MIAVEHYIYALSVEKITLKKFLLSNVRIKTFRGHLTFETLQKYLTISQKRAINKLFRVGGCDSFLGAVSGVVEKSSCETICRGVKFN